MGRSELLFVLGAIMLFGLTMLSTNRYMVDQNESIIQREYEFYSISLAQSFIEEAKTKAFDENVIGASPPVPSGLTAYNLLGPGFGETYPNFDDIDDYNGLALTDSTTRGDFDVAIQVGYVEETATEVIVNYETLFKTIFVSISNPYLNQPVQLSLLFGYIKN